MTYEIMTYELMNLLTYELMTYELMHWSSYLCFSFSRRIFQVVQQRSVADVDDSDNPQHSVVRNVYCCDHVISLANSNSAIGYAGYLRYAN